MITMSRRLHGNDREDFIQNLFLQRMVGITDFDIAVKQARYYVFRNQYGKTKRGNMRLGQCDDEKFTRLSSQMSFADALDLVFPNNRSFLDHSKMHKMICVGENGVRTNIYYTLTDLAEALSVSIDAIKCRRHRSNELSVFEYGGRIFTEIAKAAKLNNMTRAKMKVRVRRIKLVFDA